MFQPVFTLAELLQLIGVAQCVAGAAFMLLQTPNRRRALVPSLYYLALGGHFTSLYLGGGPFGTAPDGPLAVALALQCLLPAATALLVLQVVERAPPPRLWLAVLVVPLPGIALLAMAAFQSDPCAPGDTCWPAWDAFLVTRVIAAGALLLVLQLWLGRWLTERIAGQSRGRERYWLVTALVGLLTLDLLIEFLDLTGLLDHERAVAAATVIALTFVYLVVTLLFRLYPDEASVAEETEGDAIGPDAVAAPVRELTDDDRAIIGRVLDLLALEKVYQDAEYGREALARELALPEHRVTALVKAGFGKGVRQLLNDHRVAEARQLLRDTDQPVARIAFDVGFNSLPSFNRVFKLSTGQSPSDFRAEERRAARSPVPTD